MDTTNTTKKPSLSLCHANGKGTGSAVCFSLHGATADSDGYVSVTMANQKTVGSLPTFDWENAVKVRLMFADVAEFISVFRGESESIAYGKGLFHRMAGHSVRIVLRHLIEPVCGYSLELYRTGEDGSENVFRFFLSSVEGLGLCLALETSFGALAFGNQ